MKLKSFFLIGAASLYVLAGYVLFNIVAVLTSDSEFANWIGMALALPLAMPLVYALGRIDAHG